MEEKRSWPSINAVLAAAVVLLFLYLFVTGETTRFYASLLFGLYALLGQMWWAVVGLGVFQTILMVPFRVINLANARHVKEFKEKLKQAGVENNQQFVIRQRVRGGDVNLLFYLVNFFIQTISYVTIGWLFLTDFYSVKLDPGRLYDFIPYPNYPIQGTIYNLPYLRFAETVDLGIGWVLVAWAGAIIYKILVQKFAEFYRKRKQTTGEIDEGRVADSIKRFLRGSSGALTVIMVGSWFLLRNWPKKIAWALFSGDVSLVNYRFNLITALMTAFIIIWLNLPKIYKKVDLAREQGIAEAVIRKTQNELFRETLRSALVFGLGAFFITRQIPSAFELSIFTFEVISLISPLTLDRLILSKRVQVLTGDLEEKG
ncbi:MAG: hypothetical protein UX85_C0001G0229 [Candidatus Beckwithbacteria bacterium GW2011_GWB1_47_15]|uniref:Uncharacterized protein n=1 Tax=Candidatus Beckwithbacteria bacterium GW2011_GWB1_47_15 TaxID=1618371 RepID=A0A0G1UWD0_9BACT|nr:MAG: hypothetical protein UY43_C0001G0896 [Candidatus Beckwithbacteria bacterium GW2011_GWC1_49_16]AQS30867.1 hypothetical protein [uncultured bacterium]KKU36051.1 MAG: hypothetical protein UX50_C0001G0228 [Candidatus Beckwithbacteria bacterium GW2011_GWA1_46_30]KKU62015.1 MAG: hypothetical protein UX85_C0001G0229 [Candidatus Beckwithbacteria bacterium GW2011_GWB1_47_15]KKU72431.1 MAG: hypothetical protein UX97_C0001G0301 [Candidatus Beckwithbacteria bacterium GW2011_GWA2_47_25]OGD49338.1 M